MVHSFFARRLSELSPFFSPHWLSLFITNIYQNFLNKKVTTLTHFNNPFSFKKMTTLPDNNSINDFHVKLLS